ncbi:MAG: AI-2E family transporter [Rhizobiaceae bacterium]|nr:AI-2E family transporter [Rhizobiaceae bacterium]
MDENLGIKVRQQVYFWIVILVAFMGFVWLFSDVLLPFIAGMALAYFLDPVADRLEKIGASRIVATSIILVGFIILFILFLMILVPILANQLSGFMERLPDLVSQLQALIASTESTWLRDIIGVEGKTLQGSINDLMKQGAGWIATVLQQIWASGKSLVNVLSLLVVTPVVAFYLLYDWDHMVERIDSWLPRDHRETIRGIMGDIDKAVAGFVRGQGTVCLILGLFYAASLTIIGLNFGLLIGLFAGLISFIPFVGSIVGFLLSVGVALVQFWPEYLPIFLAALTFFMGQFIEGNILQPKLVGEQVGLHPVWLMFALFAFGSLFGFTGMLIAVPAAAAVGVVARYGVGRYLASELYHGEKKTKKLARAPSKKTS